MSELPIFPPTTEVGSSGEKVSLLDMSLQEVTDFVVDMGQPSYRAKQIWSWIYQRYVADFESMSVLPKALRAELSEAPPHRR